ncbi:uncharacterized protein LOC131859102 [Cryptomeria japonica]|uniref:uncharacterized protein LOC131859102 n=1 Tax=Cryptomeria japonica TaxID=3369 RepID=UPI0027DA5626|nr:uncharacterized protein LOC131859102 [Cryptomeria japonica]
MADHDLHSIMDIIPTCVKEQHNKMLLRTVSLEEVKAAVFGMGANKAPGLDGFPSLFFQYLWDILANDLWEVVEDSRTGGFILKDFNNTFIALIPKKENISTFYDFRPISSCNTIYKVISKVLFGERMEATFTFQMQKQEKAFYGPVENQRLKLLLKCLSKEVIRAVQGTLGYFFQQATHRWKCNVDIAMMILAWGLELGIVEEDIHWVMNYLFEHELISGMDSIL